MSQSNLNVSALEARAEELTALITDTHRYLDPSKPYTHYRDEYVRSANNLKGWVAITCQRALKGGNIAQIVIMAAVFLALYLLAVVADLFIGNRKKQKAQAMLIGYYQELASKQSLLQEHNRQLVNEMRQIIAKLQSSEAGYIQKLQELEAKQKVLLDLMKRFENLQQNVTR